MSCQLNDGTDRHSTPTRSRTRNVAFEARHDVRFTTGACGLTGGRSLPNLRGTETPREALRAAAPEPTRHGRFACRGRLSVSCGSRRPERPGPRPPYGRGQPG